MEVESDGGDDRLLYKLDAMKAAIPELTGRILAEAAETFLRDLQSFLVYGRGRKTGEYADSWVIQNISEKSVTIATSKQKLFFILEYGTRPHKIEGNPLLHFQIAGQDIFVSYVNHPGTPPIPHLRPAIELLKIKLPQIVQRHIMEAFITS